MQSTIVDFIHHLVSDPAIRQTANGLNGLVTGMTVNRDGLVVLDFLLERPCPAELLCQLETALEAAIPATEVIVRQRFGDNLNAQQSCQYAATLQPWLLRHLWKKDAFASSMLGQAEFSCENSQVRISLHETCCAILDLQIQYLNNLFNENIAGRATFVLQAGNADMAAYTRKMNDGHHEKANQFRSPSADSAAGSAPVPMPPSPRVIAPTAGRRSTEPNPFRRQPKAEGVIWGKIRTELTTTPIASINSEAGLVQMEGEVFNLEARSVSSGTRILVKFGLTDLENSINCILFVKPEERESIENSLKDAWIRVNAEISFDSQFAKDLQARIVGVQAAFRAPGREDKAKLKRIELHAHTKMSTKDSVCEASDLVRLAVEFGQPAVAVTDHGVVQAFPDVAAAGLAFKSKGFDIKIIYGMEGYLVDDGPTVAWLADQASLAEGFVAVDVETTGLDPAVDRVIEVAAVWFKPDGAGGFTPDRSLVTLVNPGIPVTPKSTELTGISTAMLKDAPQPLDVMEQLVDFIGNRPVVAHNAFFDLGFLRYEGFRTRQENDPRLKFNPPLVDTLALARAMLPDLPNHKLNTVAEHLRIKLDNHHRAGADAEACGMIFVSLLARSGATTLVELNQQLGHQTDADILEHKKTVNHVILLAKDPVGLYNLYRLVSISHTRYFHSRPRIPRSVLQYFRAGLTLGSACEIGDVFQAIVKLYRESKNDLETAADSLKDPKLVSLARFYDYLEIQPTTNNAFYLRDADSGMTSIEDLRNLNRLVLRLGKQLRKPVCATGDVHFLEKRHAEFRRILMTDMGYSDASDQAELYFRTTEEMLEEFAYLGEAAAREVVIDGPAAVAAQISAGLKPFPDGSFPPIIASAADEVRKLTWDTAQAVYGRDGELPPIIHQRLDRELGSIIDNGFAVMYYIAQRLVKKSNDDGYIVGSRGSVGSSLVATLCGISEVNPMPPHYICPQCHFSAFDESGEYGSGYDLPDKACPTCGTPLGREGQDIPFETFLGFDGDKQPDIDLNFSGEYQAAAHKFIEDMFGSSHTFRAGTISGYAEKNAISMVLKYFEAKEKPVTRAETLRLAKGLIGVKRTTGQHPGGIVVVPKEREIYDFSPVQCPADKTENGIITTHFDFNSLHDTILKLDILGHDDPTMLKVLGDMTGVDIRTIPIPDDEVMKLFKSGEPLKMNNHSSIDCGTLGLPELGTFMARGMIKDTKPSRFYDLVQLMGLSHGTDVWKGNAQDLIRSGTCNVSQVIGCRDSIMTSLVHWGLPPKSAFSIMEKVRKGKGLTEDEENLMIEKGVPEWYIESCKKIKYMFPKAHAAAYSISALRIAWFKVYRKAEYYCAFFTVRADEFDSRIMCQGFETVKHFRDKLYQSFREKNKISIKLNGKEEEFSPDKAQKMYYILELIEEMYYRGIEFLPVDIYQSDASHFIKVSETPDKTAVEYASRH